MDIPGYKIIRELGKGGMATVYLAIQESFDRKVAIKVMNPNLMADSQFADRFLREAKIVSKLSHPHIVPVYDAGLYDKQHYMTMDYLEGGDLKHWIKCRLELAEAFTITQQIAQALDYAHSKGYIHRDVKPDNIMFREDSSAVLTDFGIARPQSEDITQQLTQVGSVVGTPIYMSPEQSRGIDVDGRADIYSLGVIFYEMLTGSPPFSGPDAMSIGIKHISEPIPRLPSKLARLQPFLEKLLAKDPKDRYQRGMEVSKTIGKILEQLKSKPKPKKPAEPTLRTRQITSKTNNLTKSTITHSNQTKQPPIKLEPSFSSKTVKEKSGLLSSHQVLTFRFIAEDIGDFSKQIEQASEEILTWKEKFKKKCGEIKFDLTIHPWIVGRCKEFIGKLYKSGGDFDFLKSIRVTVDIRTSNGERSNHELGTKNKD